MRVGQLVPCGLCRSLSSLTDEGRLRVGSIAQQWQLELILDSSTICGRLLARSLIEQIGILLDLGGCKGQNSVRAIRHILAACCLHAWDGRSGTAVLDVVGGHDHRALACGLGVATMHLFRARL